MATRGIWEKGSKRLTGSWTWNYARQRFYIELDAKDRITGERRSIEVSGDFPDFNGWKLVRQVTPARS